MPAIYRRFTFALLLTFLASPAIADPDAVVVKSNDPAAEKIGQPLSEGEFFDALNLDFPGLEKVKQSVAAGDLLTAKKDLAAYFRTRLSYYKTLKPLSPDFPLLNDQLAVSADPIIARTGNFAPEFWLPNGQLDLHRVKIRFKERFYFWDNLGKLYQRTRDERLAKAWVGLLHAYIDQVPYTPDDPFWRTMHIGIQLRSAFPMAFRSFLEPPSFTDDDIFAFLKRSLEETIFLRHRHNLTSNQLTFEMVGLYTSGVMYPEFKQAKDWRDFACKTAIDDLHIGWLPDGMTIELSPGYGQFFSNYFSMYDLAKSAHQVEEEHLDQILKDTEPLYELYIKVMTPDRLTPATNDNAPIDVPKMTSKALQRYPNNSLFQWAASDGRRGTAPTFTSFVLPYAGFAAMRSSWARDANMLYFDFGPLGYRHAHQDKLEVLLWSYGRQILFDSGRGRYDESPPRMQNYALDTFSHSTVLVDNRPQRRPWYTDPHPRNMPYQKVKDCRWASTKQFDFAAGVYDEAYGPAGESDADPYKEGTKFTQGWVHPATHHRRVLFYKPDIFVVADTLVPNDTEQHTYDARWQVASTHTKADGKTIVTSDEGKPNLEVIPLLTDGLTVKATSAQESPEILGWDAADIPKPATTVQHLRSGRGTTQFVTLLLPLRSGQSSLLASSRAISPSTFEIALIDGRRFQLDVPVEWEKDLSITPK